MQDYKVTRLNEYSEKDKLARLESSDFAVIRNDPLVKIDNHFNFSKTPIVPNSKYLTNLEKEDSKKFILIEKKNSEVYSEDDWKDLLKKDSSFNLDKLVKSLSHGIPKKLRGKIWIYLAKSITMALNHPHDIYYNLISEKDENIEKKIRNDIDRSALMTFDSVTKEVTSFQIKDKQKLYNVLKAYAMYDKEVNYCQGTNFIVAVLVNNIASERCVFWTFFQLMNEKNWRTLCLNKIPKLLRMLDLFADQLQLKLYEMYQYFDSIGILNGEFKGLFTHYFSTIFCGYVPIEYSYRVIDLFWVYEEKIIFLCLIHLLRLQKEKIMKMPLEVLYGYLKNDLVKECMKEFGLEKSLPILMNFEEKEVNI